MLAWICDAVEAWGEAGVEAGDEGAAGTGVEGAGGRLGPATGELPVFVAVIVIVPRPAFVRPSPLAPFRGIPSALARTGHSKQAPTMKQRLAATRSSQTRRGLICIR
jgi:hypothetical protein